jgi:TolA-binding protein
VTTLSVNVPILDSFRPAILPFAFCALLLPGPQEVQTSPQLAPTVHPALPENQSDLWLVPSDSDRAARSTATYQPLTDAVARYNAGDYAGALALVSRPALASSPMGGYAAYYMGLAQLRLGQAADARRTLESLLDQKPAGYLAAGAALAAGEAAEALADHAAATRFYERLAADKSTVSEEVLSRLGRTALALGDRKTAAEAYVRLYYEFPLTDAATAAAPQIAGLSDQIQRTGYKADLGRAQLLFGARRYSEARAAFADLQRVAEGDDKELVDLRLAECDFNLKRYAAARDGAAPYLERASRKAEARFFHLSAIRELGDHEQYVTLTRALVSEFPDSSWAEEALNNLGTHYILTNEDELAANTFREAYEKFPSGARAERARRGTTSKRSGSSRAPPRSSRARTIVRRTSIGRLARTAALGTRRKRTPGCGWSTPTTRIRTTAGSPSDSSRAAQACRSRLTGSARPHTRRRPRPRRAHPCRPRR